MNKHFLLSLLVALMLTLQMMSPMTVFADGGTPPHLKQLKRLHPKKRAAKLNPLFPGRNP